MPFEFIQIPANGQGAAKEELNRLLRGGRIASVRKEFVSNAEDSYWAFCVEYLDASPGEYKPSKSSRIDYKELLSESDFALYCRLRELRKTLAEEDAVPAYSLFTNAQLADMVTKKVDSLSTLRSISGIGDARAEKYGPHFISCLTEKGGEV